MDIDFDPISRRNGRHMSGIAESGRSPRHLKSTTKILFLSSIVHLMRSTSVASIILGIRPLSAAPCHTLGSPCWHPEVILSSPI